MSDADRLMWARRDDVDAKAREWMSYLHSGEITEQGKAGFQAWLAESPDHRAAFQMLNELWTSLDRVPLIENEWVEVPREAANVAKPGRVRFFVFGAG